MEPALQYANTHEQNYTYLRFRLLTDEIGEDCRVRLEGLGVECVEDGGPHHAYGIVSNASQIVEQASGDPEVMSVEVGAPPVGF